MAKLDIFEAAPSVWCVRRGSSAAYVVKLSPGAVLVDTGSDPEGAGVMMGLQSARVGLTSIRAILLTHAHPRAASGAAALVARSGAQLLASSESASELKRPERPGALARLLGARVRPAVEVTRTTAEGELLLERFEVLAAPGGAPGHLAFYYRPARLLFTGDPRRLNRGC